VVGDDDRDHRRLRTPEVTTDAGRVIAIVVMLVGIGFVAVLTGAIAQRFVAPAEERVETSEAEVHAKLDAIAARLERLDGVVEERR
jgi:hypothetical protein